MTTLFSPLDKLLGRAKDTAQKSNGTYELIISKVNITMRMDFCNGIHNNSNKANQLNSKFVQANGLDDKMKILRVLYLRLNQ